MKRFLAMSGGGDRGCVLVGILAEMYNIEGKDGTSWEELAGISAGGLVASIISQSSVDTVQQKIGTIKDIFLDGGFHVVESWVWGGQVINMVDALMFHDSIFQSTPMQALIKKHYDGKNVQRRFSVGAYNKTLCRYETFNSDDCKNMGDAVLASAAVPIVFPNVKIDDYTYEDGGVRHLIPVNEIESWILKNKDEQLHVDVLVCFPVNDYQKFIKMIVPRTSYPLINNSIRSLGDIMLLTMQNDLKRLANLVNVTYEELIISNCSLYTHGNLTLRIISPTDGEYSDFVHMSPATSMKLFESGARSVREYLKPL